ncbi:MAG: ABC transporter permease [Chloroflexota bacterium]
MTDAQRMTDAQEQDTMNIPQSRKRHRLRWLDSGGIIGLITVISFVFIATFAPALAPHDPLKQSLADSRTPPIWHTDGGWDYPLGTDTLGRDLLSRIIYGSRVSLTVGFFGMLIATSIGLVLGMIAGYQGGRLDMIIMGVVNIILSLPYLLFVVVFAAIFGRSLFNVILIFGIIDAPLFTRLTRGEVLRLRNSVYVEAAQGVGVPTSQILWRHLLPNLIGPLLTMATFEMSAMILYEAGLGFLGLSVPPSIPSWGNMLAGGRKYLTNAPWIATLPGLAIMICALGVNLMGDWLRNVADPRTRVR